jgi:hypothetical protein
VLGIGSRIEVYENNAGILPAEYILTAATGTTISFQMSGSATVGRRLSLARRAEGSFTQFSADTSAVAGDYWRYGISFALQKTAEMIAKSVNRQMYGNTVAKATGNLASTVGLLTFSTKDYLEAGGADSLGLFSDITGVVSFYPATPGIIVPQRRAVLAVSRLGESSGFRLPGTVSLSSSPMVCTA